MILPRIVASVLAVFLSLTGLACPRDSKKPAEGAKMVVPKFGQAERKAIVVAAYQAIRTHLKAEKKNNAPDDIPAALWGAAIGKLKPVRVRNDRVNVAIVLSEKDGVEEGLYVSVPISSYAPTFGDGFALFDQLSAATDKSFGQLYHYKQLPKAK